MKEQAFVSMPFGDRPESSENEWTRLFEHGLKPLESDTPIVAQYSDYLPIKLVRADREWQSLLLKSNVRELIEDCSFVLSVLTTLSTDGAHGPRLSNPNVLWELGYAEALGKPIIVLADNESVRQLPILAAGPNICIYNHDLVKAATTPESQAVLKSIAQNLVPFIKLAVEASRNGTTHRRTARVYPSRDTIKLAELISDARRSVDILTTNLNYFVSDKLHGKSDPIEAALKRGATVRIVTLDPESIIAEYRAKQLIRGEDVPGYRRELRDGIVQLYSKFGDHERFHLHIYDDLPLQITTKIDSTLITSIITRGERARKRIQIEFHESDDGVAESFISHFQSMFDNSKSVAGFRWVQKENRSAKKRDPSDDI